MIGFDIRDVGIAFAILAFILLPLVVHLLSDVRGCSRNCRQGRNCNCGDEK